MEHSNISSNKGDQVANTQWSINHVKQTGKEINLMLSLFHLKGPVSVQCLWQWWLSPELTVQHRGCPPLLDTTYTTTQESSSSIFFIFTRAGDCKMLLGWLIHLISFFLTIPIHVEIEMHWNASTIILTIKCLLCDHSLIKSEVPEDFHPFSK